MSIIRTFDINISDPDPDPIIPKKSKRANAGFFDDDPLIDGTSAKQSTLSQQRLTDAREKRQADMKAMREDHDREIAIKREAYNREKEARAAAMTASKADPAPRKTKQPPLPGVDSFYTPEPGTSSYPNDMDDIVDDIESAQIKNEREQANQPIQGTTNINIPAWVNDQVKKSGPDMVSAPVNNNSDVNTVTIFTVAERAQLLIERYGFVNHKGTIFPTDGSTPYNLDSIKYKKERASEANNVEPDEIYKTTKKLFYRDYYLKKHVDGKENLAVFTPAAKVKFIAFDFDDSVGDLETIGYSVKQTIAIICSLGLSPFLYHSGGRGFHLEVFFDKPVGINKLNALNRIIINLYNEKGGRHMDRTYPSGSAYRIFGSWHYKTKNFSTAIIINSQPVEDGEGNKRYKIKLTPCETADKSWEHFADAPINDSSLIDNIIPQDPISNEPTSQSIKEKKRDMRNTVNYAIKPIFYNPAILKRIHESGLFSEYRRHYTAYQLGRYFKYCLKLTDRGEVRESITVWLQCHYEEFRPFLESKNLVPFADDACRLIKSAYEACCYDTLQNCLNGYAVGEPFRKEKVEIFHKLAFDYLNGLNYTVRQKKALTAMLDKAMELSSLNVGFEYPKLLEIFDVGSKSTVSAWLKEFEQDNVFICTQKGTYKTYGKTRLASQYRLMLPEDCYKVLKDNDAILEVE